MGSEALADGSVDREERGKDRVEEMRKSFYCGKYDVWCSKEDKPFMKCMEDKMDRIKDWKDFSKQMELHITEYIIPQYQSEDKIEDQVNIWSSNDCITAIKRYITRYGKNIRGNIEALRDILKIAHYAQFAYNKLKEELNEGDVYNGEDEK